MTMTTNECATCLAAARETALEGMIEILLDDHDDMSYDEAYALVDGSADLAEQIADMIADHDHDFWHSIA